MFVIPNLQLKWNVTSKDDFYSNLSGKIILKEQQVIEVKDTDPNPMTRYMSPNVNVPIGGMDGVDFGFNARIVYIYLEKTMDIVINYHLGDSVTIRDTKTLLLQGEGYSGIDLINQRSVMVGGQIIAVGDDNIPEESSSSS